MQRNLRAVAPCDLVRGEENAFGRGRSSAGRVTVIEADGTHLRPIVAMAQLYDHEAERLGRGGTAAEAWDWFPTDGALALEWEEPPPRRASRRPR